MTIRFSPVEFGERIRRERLRLGMTQQQLADIVGVKKQSISLYENGHSSPTAEIIFGFSSAGFRTQYLLFGREHVPSPQNLAPEALKFAADIVSDFEKKLVEEPMSNETKLRMMLVLLAQYIDQPEIANLRATSIFELLMSKR